jgi:hypothetical protein
MSPTSPLVLGAAALVTSPALWDFAVEQSLAFDQTLVRYLVAVAICWALLSVLVDFAFKLPAPAPGPGDGSGSQAADGAGETTFLDPQAN